MLKKLLHSGALRDEFPWLKGSIPTLWINSYFVSTTGGAPLHVVKKYIEDQKKISNVYQFLSAAKAGRFPDTSGESLGGLQFYV